MRMLTLALLYCIRKYEATANNQLAYLSMKTVQKWKQLTWFSPKVQKHTYPHLRLLININRFSIDFVSSVQKPKPDLCAKLTGYILARKLIWEFPILSNCPSNTFLFTCYHQNILHLPPSCGVYLHSKLKNHRSVRHITHFHSPSAPFPSPPSIFTLLSAHPLRWLKPDAITLYCCSLGTSHHKHNHHHHQPTKP